jgi:hypothetical protein
MKYYTQGNENIESYGNTIASLGPCPSNNPYSSNEWLRTSFGYSDYEYHRPESRLPTCHKDIVAACQKVYKNSGLIRNIIDLMSDFCVQGMRISHQNERTEIFYQSWFHRVGGVSLSERFANSLFKNGSTVVRRRNAKLTKSDKKRIYQAIAEDVDFTRLDVRKNNIPYEYNCLNPATVELVGGRTAVFANKKQYKIVIPTLYSMEFDESLGIPIDLINEYKSDNEILLPINETLVYHYKKDDWEEWPTPIIYSILRDVQILDRMKLADLSALDGAINNIRIVKLGSLEEKLWPEDGAFAKLSSMLAANTSAGMKDIVWGPDIELIESKSDVYKFLGDDKYIPVLNAIYAGMGIPPTLTGTDHSSGTTNNLISLKTLIRRLEYCRTLLLDFWAKEIEMVRQAMGFSTPAYIEFDNNNLGEEEAEKKLWIELAERSIISDEAVIRKFGANPRLESSRINRENKQRKNGKRAKKAGAYHNPQLEEALKQKLVETGLVELADFDKALDEIKVKKPKPMPKDAGRPKNTKDTSPRKRRQVNPVSKAGLRIWASQAQDLINEVTTPLFLAHFNKKNMRSLSSAEASIAEEARFGVLLNIEPMSELSKENIVNHLNAKVNDDIYEVYQRTIANTKIDLSRDLTINDLRSIQLDLYMEYFNDN